MDEARGLLCGLVLLAGLALICAVPSAAQTADGQTPAEETVCDHLSGAAFGLCNAYCEAMDCELLDDGDPFTFPNASAQACLKVKDNFIKITGQASLPCDICPPGEGQEGCACETDDDCSGGLICELGDDGGLCTEDDGGGA